MTTDELKPCPFCGGYASYNETIDHADRKNSKITCDDCLAEIECVGVHKEQVYKEWNTRAETEYECNGVKDECDEIIRELVGAVTGAKDALIQTRSALYALSEIKDPTERHTKRNYEEGKTFLLKACDEIDKALSRAKALMGEG